MNGLTFSFESAWRFLFICQYTGYAENVITTPMITKNKLHTLLGKFIHNLRGKAYVLGIWTTSLIWMDKTCWWHFSAIGSDAYPPIMLLSIPPSLPPSLPPYLIYACVYNLRFCFYCYTIDVGWCQCFFLFLSFLFHTYTIVHPKTNSTLATRSFKRAQLLSGLEWLFIS